MAKQQGNTETFKQLCADYVLNILEQDERLQFEEMLDEASEEQRELYQQMRKKGNELLFSDVDNPSPGELREKLLASVEEGETTVPEAAFDEGSTEDKGPNEEVADTKSAEVSPGMVVSVVLGIICLSLVFYAFSLQSEISDQDDTIAEQEDQIANLESEMQELQQMLTVVDSHQLRVVRLLGMEASPFGYGNVVWDVENNRAIVRLGELPSPAEGEQYQLWAIFENKAIDISSFSVDENGNALFMIDNMDGLEDRADFSFAVTLESGTDSAQPNGEMYLMGSFNGQ